MWVGIYSRLILKTKKVGFETLMITTRDASFKILVI